MDALDAFRLLDLFGVAAGAASGALAARRLDSLAVGFFAVASTQRAKQVGVTVPAQLLIGVLGGSGGALLRDILTARTPEIFRHGELNALAALAAASVFLVADIIAPTTSAMFIGLLVGFALRAAAIRFDLRGPAPRTSRRGDP